MFLFLSLLFQSLALILGKFASITIHSFSIKDLFLNPFYICSLLCLAFQALTWQQTLRNYPLSWSYMFMSGIYPIIMFSSFFIFHEEITRNNIIGTIIIVVGLFVLIKEKE